MVKAEIRDIPRVEADSPAGAQGSKARTSRLDSGVLKHSSSVFGTLVPGVESGSAVAVPANPAARTHRGERALVAMARAGVRQQDSASGEPAEPKSAELLLLGQRVDIVSPVAQGSTDGGHGTPGADDISRAIGNGHNPHRGENGEPPDGGSPTENGTEGDDSRERDRAHYAFAWQDSRLTIDLARRKLTGGEDIDALNIMLDGTYDTATLDVTVSELGPLQGVEKARMEQPQKSQKTVGVIGRPDSLPNGYVTRSLISRTNPVDIIGDQYDPVRGEEIERLTTEFIRGSGNVNVTTMTLAKDSGQKYDVLIWSDQPNVGDILEPMQPERDVLGITGKIREVLGMLSPDGVLIIPPGNENLDPIREDARRIEYGYTVTRVPSAIVDANAQSAQEGMPRDEDYTHETIIIKPKPRV